MISIDEDEFYYTEAVRANILYVLYVYMSDMRCPIKAQAVKAKVRYAERRQIEEQLQKKAERKKASKKEGQFSTDYADKCDTMEERIEDMEMPDVAVPEKIIAFFHKKLAKVDELEAFCASKPGGQEFYNRRYPLLRQRVQWELDDYMEDQYPSDLKHYEEEQAEKKRVNGMKNRIKKEIKAAGNIKATDLKKLFPENEEKLYTKAMRDLEKSEAVIKGKDGSRVVYTLKEK